MSGNKSIDKICVVIVALTLLLMVLFCNGQSFGIEMTARAIGYENRLFDRSKVHTLDIVINDWDAFLETCESEVYSPCNIIIDGEAVKNVGIRGKGNTSLSSVKNMNSSRYSFKIEFDQYENGKSYHGLDKLCLNNVIQDNTYMKDYLAYTLMYDFGVDAPLCSYVYITVNGEDWGLYLAVESIEDSFLERNYGSNYGDLYKPDSMSFGGGGPGNGKDFSMGGFMNKNSEDAADGDTTDAGQQTGGMPGFGGGMPDFGGNMPADFDFSNFDPAAMFGGEMPDFGNGEMPDFGGENGGAPGGFGMGSDDVKLKYSDDAISSYSNIFNNAKTVVTTADKNRLIASLKSLLEQDDLENTVDIDEVLRYFVVHNFLCNGDSYTGQMIHNYYLYEENGQLSMIPWDYNLAYGSFMGGNASSSVNSPIDTPVSNGMSDRPMVSWIFDNEAYTEQYHQLFREFLNSVDFEELVSETAAMIGKYVEKDPTKFCTYEDFQKGVDAIGQFCTLRAESVSGQLDGTIPATSDGQKADSSTLVDSSALNISDMGTMGSGGGFGGFDRSSKPAGNTGDTADKNTDDKNADADTDVSSESSSKRQRPNGGSRPDFGGDMPADFDPSQFGGDMPADFDPSQFGGDMPADFDPSQFGGDMPADFDPSQFGGERPDGFPSGGSKRTDTDSQNETEQPADASSGEGAAESDSGRPGGSSRPQMGGGNFPGMNAGTQTTDPAVYILLGVSVLCLLIGLGIACKFKR